MPRLPKPAWEGAARLTGFSQYQPVDQRPAVEPTEIRVLYSAQAIYFAIIATASDPGSVRATLSKRDNISNDDRVTIYLDTFNDRRRAFFFGANPLGVQLDGVRTEGAASAGNMFGGSVDLNPDFRFETKGRLTPTGYLIEMRIPFKSLRFPTGREVGDPGGAQHPGARGRGHVDRRAARGVVDAGAIGAARRHRRRGTGRGDRPAAVHYRGGVGAACN